MQIKPLNDNILVEVLTDNSEPENIQVPTEGQIMLNVRVIEGDADEMVKKGDTIIVPNSSIVASNRIEIDTGLNYYFLHKSEVLGIVK